MDYSYLDSTAQAGAIAGGFIVSLVISLIIAVFCVVCMWKVFEKAGKPGWAAIVPVYNLWVSFEIGGQEGWKSILAYIPVVNIVALVFSIMATMETAKRFGKSN